MYIALTALVINLVVTVVLTAVFRVARFPAGPDETAPAHYLAEEAGAAEAAVPVTPMAAEAPRPVLCAPGVSPHRPA